MENCILDLIFENSLNLGFNKREEGYHTERKYLGIFWKILDII